MASCTIKYYEAEQTELFNRDYIVYADSLNVMNEAKPFKIASRVRIGNQKTCWSEARLAYGRSFETKQEAEQYLEDYFKLCNIKYKERRFTS